MEKLKTTNCCIKVKRRILISDNFIKSFIFSNINYRRYVWNNFVEASRNSVDLKEFKPAKYRTELVNTVDRKSSSFYCEMIETQVYKDVCKAINKCIQDSKKDHKYHYLRFKKFDRYFGTFTVNARPTFFKLADSTNRLNTRVNLISESLIWFRANKNLYIPITLKEPLFYDTHVYGNEVYYSIDKKSYQTMWTHSDTRCNFRLKDIKEITFIHEMGKFYIQLSINMTFINMKRDIKQRFNLAGIDLGIHNPIMLFDGSNFFHGNLSEKELNRLSYLERRTKRLQQIMDRKFLINKSRGINPYSKNYEKVRKKFRKTWKKIYNLRSNWRKKISKLIVTNYKMIVVDNMSIPKVDYSENNSMKRKINHKSRFIGMYLFQEFLEYSSIKYGTEYITSKSKTTRTCSKCGYVGNKLLLSDRIFICDSCGFKIDRDKNSAINCFMQKYSVD